MARPGRRGARPGRRGVDAPRRGRPDHRDMGQRALHVPSGRRLLLKQGSAQTSSTCAGSRRCHSRRCCAKRRRLGGRSSSTRRGGREAWGRASSRSCSTPASTPVSRAWRARTPSSRWGRGEACPALRDRGRSGRAEAAGLNDLSRGAPAARTGRTVRRAWVPRGPGATHEAVPVTNDYLGGFGTAESDTPDSKANLVRLGRRRGPVVAAGAAMATGGAMGRGAAAYRAAGDESRGRPALARGEASVDRGSAASPGAATLPRPIRGQ